MSSEGSCTDVRELKVASVIMEPEQPQLAEVVTRKDAVPDRRGVTNEVDAHLEERGGDHVHAIGEVDLDATENQIIVGLAFSLIKTKSADNFCFCS